MGFNPVNLTFRFLLEIIGLIGLFRLGLELGTGLWRWVLAAGFTFAAMALWATFRVPGDRSARGEAPYSVSGPVRLLIELVVFGAGAFGWFVAGPNWMAWAYVAALAFHHIISYDRIAWLLRGGTAPAADSR
ncbi:MAG: YrdB family protein [Acidimicrobiia bacterium]